LTFLAIEMIGIILSTFAPNYVVLVVGRFVLGFGSVGVFMISFVLSEYTNYTKCLAACEVIFNHSS
jgi:predicted MFS family arabinose efflux permease